MPYIGIRHRVDGTWWQGSSRIADIWTPDPCHAKPFLHAADAAQAAYIACHADPRDYVIVPIPVSAELVSA